MILLKQRALLPACCSLFSNGQGMRVPFWLDVKYFWVYVLAFYISSSSMKEADNYRHFPTLQVGKSTCFLFIASLSRCSVVFLLSSCSLIACVECVASIWGSVLFTIMFLAPEPAIGRHSQSHGCLKGQAGVIKPLFLRVKVLYFFQSFI